jgi:NRPS condensation-like uncharacterized protein
MAEAGTARGRPQIFGRLNQSYALLEQIYNANSCEWIELDRALNSERLLESARRVIDRHPMARSVYRRRGPWFEWIHTDRQLPINIEHQCWDSDEEDEVRAKILRNIKEFRVLRTDQHPFRFILITTPRRHFLQIMTSHVYTDGRAANIFTGDLVACYCALEAGADWRPGVVDIADRNHDHMFLADLSLPRKVQLFCSALGSLLLDVFTFSGRLRLVSAQRDNTELLLAEIPATLIRDVKARSKELGLSIHVFFLVALARTLEAFNSQRGASPRQLRIVDNFSLRRFSQDPAIEDLYDCVAVPYTMEVNLDLSDARLLRDLNAQLESMKAGRALRELYKYRFYHWMSLPMPKWLAAKIAVNLLIRANIVCTNVGQLSDKLKVIGQARVLNFVSFPPLFPPGDIMFQFSSFDGKLRLVTLYHPNQLSRQQIQEQMVSQFVAHLEVLLKGASEDKPVPASSEYPLASDKLSGMK